MLDINFILNNQLVFLESMKKRNINYDLSKIFQLNEYRKKSTQAIQDLQSERNKISDNIGKNKSILSEDEINTLKKQVVDINHKIKILEDESNDRLMELESEIINIPNILQEDVQYGESDKDNIVLSTFGEKPVFDFTPIEHDEIGKKTGCLDFERAVKISGSRFVIMRKEAAKLERALRNFMIDVCNEFGFEEVHVPFLINYDSGYRAGQLPKFEEDLFKTTNDMFLIPTSETSMVNIYANELIKEAELPIKLCSYSPCFRSEAGAAGKDTRGILRQHQFTKVEIVAITAPEKSEEMHQLMLKCAETILQRLNLHYRVMILCGGDTGHCSSKTYDIEVWLPGQDKYREICSCSNTTDYQARRAKTKLTRHNGSKEYVHMLNSSALAIGRTIIAIMENYQTKEGNFIIPDVLKKYL